MSIRPRIRVIDFETTGDAPPDHAICEVGWTDLVARDDDLLGNPTNWEVVAGRGILINPGIPIPAETSAIHHIVDGDVAAAPSWSDVAPRIFSEPGITAFAAHEASFERLWVDPSYLAGRHIICTRKASMKLWPDAERHSNQYLRYLRNYPDLDRSIASQTHRAMPDSYVTAFHLRDFLELAPVSDLIRWSYEPSLTRVCRVGDYRNGGKGTPWANVEDGYLRWILSKDFDEDTMFTAKHELQRRRDLENEEAERWRQELAPPPPSDGLFGNLTAGEAT